MCSSVVSDSSPPHGLYIAHQALLPIGFSRQEYWSGFPFPPAGAFPNPEIALRSLASPALPAGFFITGATWEACVTLEHAMVVQIWLLARFDKMNTWLSKSPPKLQAPAGMNTSSKSRPWLCSPGGMCASRRQTDPKGHPEDAGQAGSVPLLQVSTQPSLSSTRGLGPHCSTVTRFG